MALRRVHLRISGLVQGVSYRATAQDQARRLGVAGWVRNLPDGGVEGEAEAEGQRIDRFIAWCRQGPAEARVTEVLVAEVQVTTPYVGFEVRR